MNIITALYTLIVSIISHAITIKYYTRQSQLITIISSIIAATVAQIPFYHYTLMNISVTLLILFVIGIIFFLNDNFLRFLYVRYVMRNNQILNPLSKKTFTITLILVCLTTSLILSQWLFF